MWAVNILQSGLQREKKGRVLWERDGDCVINFTHGLLVAFILVSSVIVQLFLFKYADCLTFFFF